MYSIAHKHVRLPAGCDTSVPTGEVSTILLSSQDTLVPTFVCCPSVYPNHPDMASLSHDTFVCLL